MFLETHPLTYEQLIMILDNSYDEICVIDADARIIYSNPAVERNYSLKAEEVVGKTAYEYYQNSNYYPFLTPIVLHERKTITIEQISDSGKKMIITATPVFNNIGQLEMVIMNTRNVNHLLKIAHDLNSGQQLSDLYYHNSGINTAEAHCLEQMVSKSDSFLNKVETARLVAPTNANILLLGETGTGKTLMAKYIHQNSKAKDGPFFTINCAAIPEHLLQSELFGHKKGSFTGATADKPGIFDLAANGTLFLDEISEIPMHIQAKLLHAIQERTYLPVGGTSYRELKARIISASNKNLAEEVENGNFRSDLYYRLNVIEIDMPPLRQRQGNVTALSKSFLENYNELYKTYHTIDNEALAILEQYDWPGNIRQLQNFIERLVLMVNDEKIMPHHLPESILSKSATKTASKPTPAVESLDEAVEQLIKSKILAAIDQYGSSRKVAKALGISQNKATRLICKYRDQQ